MFRGSMWLRTATALFVLIAWTPAIAQDAGVHAFVIGVGANPDKDALVDAPNKAIKFAERVVRTFPGAKVRLLVDSALPEGTLPTAQRFSPTEEELERQLAEIKHLPERSLVIFYFIGHGVKEELPQPSAVRSELHLLLTGASQKNYLDGSVKVDDVFDALSKTRLTTLMVFLDCCFSGPQVAAFQLPYERLWPLNIRGMILSSSSRTQQSQSGAFTDKLLEAWDESATQGLCLPPFELEKRVGDKLQALFGDDLGPFMRPQPWLPSGITWCIADLSGPRCMLLFRFPKGAESELLFEIKDDKGVTETALFDPNKMNPSIPFVFSLNVPRKPLSLIVRDPNGRRLLERLLSKADTDRDVLQLTIPPDPNLFSNAPVEARETRPLSQLNVARMIAAYGADASDAYFETAREFRICYPDRDTKDYLAKAAESGNPLYRLANGTIDGATLAFAKQDPDKVLSVLQNVGSWRTAGDLADALAKESEVSATPQPNAMYYRYQAVLSYQLAGRTDKASDAFEQLTKKYKLGKQQEAITAQVMRQRPDVLRESLENFAVTRKTWDSVQDAPPRYQHNPGLERHAQKQIPSEERRDGTIGIIEPDPGRGRGIRATDVPDR